MSVIIRPYRRGEEQYVAEAHRRIYTVEYHWGPSFTHYAAEIALSFPSRGHDAGEELWVAEAEGSLVGSVMLCRTDEEGTGQLRLFLVEKSHRCQGIGHALTAALLDKARAVGYKRLILWSASPLHDALTHYEKLGFHTIETVDNHDWSLDGEVVTEIKMVLSLI